MALRLGEFNNLRKKIEKAVEIKALKWFTTMNKLSVLILRIGILA